MKIGYSGIDWQSHNKHDYAKSKASRLKFVDGHEPLFLAASLLVKLFKFWQFTIRAVHVQLHLFYFSASIFYKRNFGIDFLYYKISF